MCLWVNGYDLVRVPMIEKEIKSRREREGQTRRESVCVCVCVRERERESID
jgi:hypothetical protein